MFERYTEAARRALFFARYEVSELGATSIQPEHLLLGITRESHGVVKQIMSMAQLSTEGLREDLERRAGAHERIPTSVEVPFSGPVQHALGLAAEEADALTHRYIGPEHLLLGLLRQNDSVAASILGSHGIRLEGVRSAVAAQDSPPAAPPHFTPAALVDEIDQIRQAAVHLAGIVAEGEAKALAERIRERLEALRRHFTGR